MMREAANRQENREGDSSAATGNIPSKPSSSAASAPDVLVVPKESDSAAVHDASNVSVSATAGHGEVM